MECRRQQQIVTGSGKRHWARVMHAQNAASASMTQWFTCRMPNPAAVTPHSPASCRTRASDFCAGAGGAYDHTPGGNSSSPGFCWLLLSSVSLSLLLLRLLTGSPAVSLSDPPRLAGPAADRALPLSSLLPGKGPPCADRALLRSVRRAKTRCSKESRSC
jgi:hypothetical protein